VPPVEAPNNVNYGTRTPTGMSPYQVPSHSDVSAKAFNRELQRRSQTGNLGPSNTLSNRARRVQRIRQARVPTRIRAIPAPSARNLVGPGRVLPSPQMGRVTSVAARAGAASRLIRGLSTVSRAGRAGRLLGPVGDALLLKQELETLVGARPRRYDPLVDPIAHGVVHRGYELATGKPFPTRQFQPVGEGIESLKEAAKSWFPEINPNAVIDNALETKTTPEGLTEHFPEDAGYQLEGPSTSTFVLVEYYYTLTNAGDASGTVCVRFPPRVSTKPSNPSWEVPGGNAAKVYLNGIQIAEPHLSFSPLSGLTLTNSGSSCSPAPEETDLPRETIPNPNYGQPIPALQTSPSIAPTFTPDFLPSLPGPMEFPGLAPPVEVPLTEPEPEIAPGEEPAPAKKPKIAVPEEPLFSPTPIPKFTPSFPSTVTPELPKRGTGTEVIPGIDPSQQPIKFPSPGTQPDQPVKLPDPFRRGAPKEIQSPTKSRERQTQLPPEAIPSKPGIGIDIETDKATQTQPQRKPPRRATRPCGPPINIKCPDPCPEIDFSDLFDRFDDLQTEIIESVNISGTLQVKNCEGEVLEFPYSGLDFEGVNSFATALSSALVNLSGCEPVLALSDDYGVQQASRRPTLNIIYKEKKGQKWGLSTFNSAVYYPDPLRVQTLLSGQETPPSRTSGEYFASVRQPNGSKLRAFGASPQDALFHLSYLINLSTDKPAGLINEAITGQRKDMKFRLLHPRKIEFYSDGQGANIRPDDYRYIPISQ